jgi:hypothetical protein|uniref:Uncharacterized protein n=1 Tax=virus sp. ctyMK1 TaxID=2828002 RepID=A0A8S5RF63_9VIRU|nr:MAG TPA: hypothetical protein [virus sp. ctyMK1]
MNSIEKFEKKNMAAFETLALMNSQKKEIEKQENEVKKMLLEGMKKYGIDAIDNDLVRINYIPKSESVSVDLKKLRVEDPDTYRAIELAHNKRITKKEHIRITVK